MPRRSFTGLALSLAVVVAACGSGNDDTTDGATSEGAARGGSVAALPANFDLAADSPQRADRPGLPPPRSSWVAVHRAPSVVAANPAKPAAVASTNTTMLMVSRTQVPDEVEEVPGAMGCDAGG